MYGIVRSRRFALDQSGTYRLIVQSGNGHYQELLIPMTNIRSHDGRGPLCALPQVGRVVEWRYENDGVWAIAYNAKSSQQFAAPPNHVREAFLKRVATHGLLSEVAAGVQMPIPEVRFGDRALTDEEQLVYYASFRLTLVPSGAEAEGITRSTWVSDCLRQGRSDAGVVRWQLTRQARRSTVSHRREPARMMQMALL